MITPINSATVAEAVRKLLENWQALVDLGVRVDRSERINTDPAKTPWAGVYVVGEDYPSRTLGAGSGYRMQQIGLTVVLQASSSTSGADCQDKLEQMKQAVISALLTDQSCGNTVTVIDKFSVRYAQYMQQAGQPAFQSAIINFTGLVPVNAS